MFSCLSYTITQFKHAQAASSARLTYKCRKWSRFKTTCIDISLSIAIPKVQLRLRASWWPSIYTYIMYIHNIYIICIYIYIICIYIYIYNMYIHIYICVYTHIHVYIYTYIYHQLPSNDVCSRGFAADPMVLLFFPIFIELARIS